jgi:GT2 family glycosyltransferase
MNEVATLMMVTYNRLDLTKQTLKNIIENTNRPFNFVIVDNASIDGTQKYLRNFSLEHNNDKKGLLQKIVYVFNNENKGIAIGRNQALFEANNIDTTWYSTIDNDVLLPDNWLTDCIKILSSNKSYGMMGVNFEPVKFQTIRIGEYEIQNKIRGNLGTACTVFHKNFHKMVGFFNTEYGLYGEEDADMGARARAMGFKLGYLKDNGIHLGEGDNDIGEYRTFKTESHKNNLKQFNENARDYFTNKKPLYIPCKIK